MGGMDMGGMDMGGMDMGSADAADDTGGSDYGPTMFNAEGDDDDCKYHMSFTVDPVRKNQNVSFTVTVSTLASPAPAKGAAVRAEVYLDETHPAPNTDQKAVETSPGVYTVGPIEFDASGRWTVRFHFYEDCDDGEESPHGHAAFYIDVP
jgi:hypothetical protein